MIETIPGVAVRTVCCFCSGGLARRGAVRQAAGSTYRAPGGTTLRLILDETNVGPEVTLGEIIFPPNSDSGDHKHGAIEMFYIVSGELDHVVNGKSQILKPGMTGYVKPPERCGTRPARPAPRPWWCGCRAKRARRSRRDGKRSLET